MLVGYSSSSEEESEAGSETATDRNTSFSRKCQEEDDGDDGNDGCPAKKKAKMKEQTPKTRSVCVCIVIPYLVASNQVILLCRT